MTEMQVGSRLLFVGGQVGWNEQQQFETDDFAEQVGQALRNIVAILKEGGAGPQHITRMTWYVCDKQEYVSALRSEEHTSELQSLMRSSYAVFCLKKKNHKPNEQHKSRQ